MYEKSLEMYPARSSSNYVSLPLCLTLTKAEPIRNFFTLTWKYLNLYCKTQHGYTSGQELSISTSLKSWDFPTPYFYI